MNNILFVVVFLMTIIECCMGQNASVGAWMERKSITKAKKLQSLVERVEREHGIPANLTRESWSAPHRPNSRFAIFTVGMQHNLRPREVKMFLGTARKAGFDDDIVVAVYPEMDQDTKNELKLKNAVVYAVSAACGGQSPKFFCSFTHLGTNSMPVAMLRFYLYQWWAQLYSSNTVIMVADFRDVFFQMHPFYYKYPEWRPPAVQLTVFQEFHPNKVISRCGHNRRWIRNCYGEEGLAKIETNTVICSGITIGTRDALIGYTNLMTRQLNPRVRYKSGPPDSDANNEKCFFEGMDQGLHNWLVYTGLLDMYMNVKIYQQGEGPVNTLGAFFGKNALLKRSLRDWGMIKGEAPQAYIYNWNGEKSPVVHQLDRFLESDIKGGYAAVLGAMQGVVG
mmetsp:Transcript_4104/g.6356  ORF Transcript_4104/g.6356 Transcript_4104/m.6356 type:complete len:394 (-) Transcript_4104:103-1284(-)|eukprot:CAMPEP_0185026964 /NCGR_PEP_ID=MMETSP1103-20130426/11670_1 /TAXON_ID=36769 /ORGANISM="Paraphysomonas bandaiensis, Strain Caron Lab Isolate" /LENGTH=393 /DNA_ID=CAMNT_0027560755 /DNA_START=141 /DNA_END=1322 /DNA_ORIENTATION=+